jgi:hypothetical protein
MITDQIIELINKSRRGKTTLEEEAQLIEWIDSDPNALKYLAKDKDVKMLIQEWAAYEQMNTDEAKEKAWECCKKRGGKKEILNQGQSF